MNTKQTSGISWVSLSTLFSVTVLLTMGCGHPLQRKLEGRWLGHAIENVSAAHMAMASGWVKGTSMEFSGSNVTVAVPAEEPRLGEYEVVKAHEGAVTLAFVRPSGERDTAHFSLDDKDTLRWQLGDGRSVVLKRER